MSLVNSHGEGASSPSENEEIVDKKGLSSSVIWKWFGFLSNDKEQSDVWCKLCRKQVATKTGNTTNLFYHLKQNHAMEHAESLSLRKGTQIKSKPVVVRPKQSTMSAFVPYEQTSKRHKDITNAITYCIAKDMQPISTVEKQGFKKLIKILDPRYVLPGRKYFSHTALPKMYAECREKVEEALQRDLTYFASTTDLWSSRTSEPYISLTIHYIDKEWNLQNKCLQTSFLAGIS